MAQDYATEYLRLGQAGQRRAELRVPFQLLPTLARRVSLKVRLQPDLLEAGRAHDEIRVRWDSRTRLLPELQGTIRFRIAGSTTCVRVEAFFNIFPGRFGRLFDYIGRCIARKSVYDFTLRLVTYLEMRDRVWRSDFPRSDAGIGCVGPMHSPVGSIR